MMVVDTAMIHEALQPVIDNSNTDNNSMELDDTTLDYLVQVLSEQDAYDDVDALVETVAPFLNDDRAAAEAVVRDLASHVRPAVSSRAAAPTTTSTSTSLPTHHHHVDDDEMASSSSSSSSATGDDPKQQQHTNNEPTTLSPKSHKERRKQKRLQKKQKNKTKNSNNNNNKQISNNNDNSPDDDIHHVVARLQRSTAHELNELDDYSSAWHDAQTEGRVWGGRGYGGRGVNRGLHDYQGKDVVVQQVTLHFAGATLLQETHLALAHGHRYGLMGPNGVGKSTLLRRMAARSIPGWPLHLTVQMVEQEVLGTTRTVGECLSTSAEDTLAKQQHLQQEQTELEGVLEDDAVEAEELESAAERLSEIYDELEVLEQRLQQQSDNSTSKKTGGWDQVDAKAKTILKGLQFQESMLDTPGNVLSGGWRMRLALAQALYAKPDVLLLDEPTNHLDLSAILFLEQYLVDSDMTVVVVSHDGHFLDAVCTDIIYFEPSKQKLKYHVGNYTSFREMQEQEWARNSSKADAVARQEKKAKEFIAKQRSMANSKHRDDNKQKQAAERQKKLGRIGLFAENGQKFKLLAEGNTKKGGSNRAGHIFGNYTNAAGFQSAFVSNETHAFGEDRQLLNFKFPAAAPLKGGGNMPYITMEDCRFRYGDDRPWLLEHMTLNVAEGSRIAIVGKNGAGKSTLLQLLCGELDVKGGDYHRHPNLKVAHIAQHHIEQLGDYLECTPVEYFMQQHHAKTELEARQFLGQFGLVGSLALQLIGTLSGGQKARLAFATVMYNAPHVLVLDEPTNHLDRDSLESLATAVDNFQGAVVMVSHHQSFMAKSAKEMWTVADGRVKVQVADGELTTFDDLYDQYKESLRKEVRGKKR